MKGKDLLSIGDLAPQDARRIIDRAVEMKRQGMSSLLAGRTLALLFEKPSLRTRVSFDVAMYQLGGHCLYLSQTEIGLGSREPLADVARTLSRYVDVIGAREREIRLMNVRERLLDLRVLLTLLLHELGELHRDRLPALSIEPRPHQRRRWLSPDPGSLLGRN